jgi:tetratricopeptide (TPR) repeat protein
MAAQLFISYRRSCKAEVIAARAALEAAGVAVLLDLDDIDPLADFPQRIRDGIAASHAMLIWWSADYAESDICLQELRLAWQHARRHSSDVARRVWVLNPENGGQHVFAGELNRSNFLVPPKAGEEAAWASGLRGRLQALLPEGPIADERAAEPAPPRYDVPTPSREFTGRGAELMRIHSALFPARVGAAAAGVAVQTHGLGGIGKTELAAKYAQDFAAAYPAGVLWLNLAGWQAAKPATEADAQTAWLRALDAALAKVPELWNQLALDAEGKPRPAPEVRQRLARHLGETRPCLVVLDNLPELSPLDVRRRILDFLAAPGAEGKTLVTTRDARPVGGYVDLELTVMGADDALRLLARYRPAQAAAERAAMTALIAEVGGHTQALMLLGERYREDAGGYPRALADLREQGRLPRIEAIAGQLGEELGARARGIVATFAISIEALSEAAHHLLALASVCAPNAPIPDDLLALAFGGNAKADDFALAQRAVLRASLLERRGEGDALRIHPLVAQAALALLNPNRAELEAAVAAALLERLAVLQSDESQTRSLSNDANQANHFAQSFNDEMGVRLFLLIAKYEVGHGEFGLASKANMAALDLAASVLGECHLETFTCMNNLAETKRSEGKIAEAVELSEKVIRLGSGALPNTHPSILAAKSNRAGLFWMGGDHEAAKAMHEEVLEIRRRVLGEADPDTLSSMANLAVILRAENDLLGALMLEMPVLDKRREKLGVDHLRTLDSTYNLAGTLWALGQVPEAIQHYDDALRRRDKILGPNHPNTTESAWSLFYVLTRCSGVDDVAGVVFEKYLNWLIDHDPADLGASQRRIRTNVRRMIGATQ